ncbi:MAG: pyridoxamine 5'-phosphate oxidase family protein [Coriobacteriia bacterium]|nr:pyridoxamine 5'-phosphate oxidase family protein [Coriobacteriia bacterium]
MRRDDRAVTQLAAVEEILLKCKTCRVAMVNEGAPYVVPLSFGYAITGSEELELYFHSALEGRKLDILRSNHKVCFEISYEGPLVQSKNPCSYGYQYASVIGFGEVSFLESKVEKSEALSALFRHQALQAASFTTEQVDKVCVFKIVSTDYTAKQR